MKIARAGLLAALILLVGVQSPSTILRGSQEEQSEATVPHGAPVEERGPQVRPWVRTHRPIIGSQPDPLVQRSTSFSPLVASTFNSFPGISNSSQLPLDQSLPPDANAAVGEGQLVQIVNSSYQVFDSGGNTLKGPVSISNLWSGLVHGDPTMMPGQSVCTRGAYAWNGNYFTDPVVLFDKINGPDIGHWVISQIASSDHGVSGTYCVAVSQTRDATGIPNTWNAYQFTIADPDSPSLKIFPDYPKMGIGVTAYYATFNVTYRATLFNSPCFQGAEVVALNRNAMLANQDVTPVTQWLRASSGCSLGTSDGSLLPADFDGGTINEPPSTEPEFLLELDPSPDLLCTVSSQALNLFKFHVDFTTTPPTSTWTGPTPICVDTFTEACVDAEGAGSPGPCIQQNQSYTTQLLDPLGDRLMNRLVYRNFPGDHESLVANHSVCTPPYNPPPSPPCGVGSGVGIRWYEIRNVQAITPTVYQSGTYSPDSNSRWMGSIAMDQFGQIALGYSVSGSNLNPSIRVTANVPGLDPLGIMEPESTIVAGGASQSGFTGANRWGDYTSMAINPGDDATFLYTNEYYQATALGTPNWITWMHSFRLYPGAGSVPDGSIKASGSGGGITLSWSPSCYPVDTDYEIYRGTLGVYYSHTIVTCTTHGALSWTFSGTPNSYYLVVPKNRYSEGGYGHQGNGTPIPPGSSACMAAAVVCP